MTSISLHFPHSFNALAFPLEGTIWTAFIGIPSNLSCPSCNAEDRLAQSHHAVLDRHPGRHDELRRADANLSGIIPADSSLPQFLNNYRSQKRHEDTIYLEGEKLDDESVFRLGVGSS